MATATAETETKTPEKQSPQTRADVLTYFARLFVDDYRNFCETKRAIDAQFWNAVDCLVGSFDDGAIPASLRGLEAAVRDLKAGVEAYDDHDERGLLNSDQDAPPALWNACTAVAGALKRAESAAAGSNEAPAIESIKTLHDQGVNHRQIAEMYGFCNETGNVEVWKVQAELDKPGCVIEKPGYVAPWEKEKKAEAQRMQREIDRLESTGRHRPQPATARCKETAEQLWSQKVGTEQASQMLRIPEAQAIRLWQQFDADTAGAYERIANGETIEVAGEAMTLPASEDNAPPMEIGQIPEDAEDAPPPETGTANVSDEAKKYAKHRTREVLLDEATALGLTPRPDDTKGVIAEMILAIS